MSPVAKSSTKKTLALLGLDESPFHDVEQEQVTVDNRALKAAGVRKQEKILVAIPDLALLGFRGASKSGSKQPERQPGPSSTIEAAKAEDKKAESKTPGRETLIAARRGAEPHPITPAAVTPAVDQSASRTQRASRSQRPRLTRIVNPPPGFHRLQPVTIDITPEPPCEFPSSTSAILQLTKNLP